MSFSWNLSYPYNTPQRGLGTYDANGNLIPPTRAEWDAKVPFAKAGKPVAVLHRNGKPIITEPLIGVTLRDVVKSIERGLTSVLDPSDSDQRPLVYAAVAMSFFAQLQKDAARPCASPAHREIRSAQAYGARFARQLRWIRRQLELTRWCPDVRCGLVAVHSGISLAALATCPRSRTSSRDIVRRLIVDFFVPEN